MVLTLKKTSVGLSGLHIAEPGCCQQPPDSHPLGFLTPVSSHQCQGRSPVVTAWGTCPLLEPILLSGQHQAWVTCPLLGWVCYWRKQFGKVVGREKDVSCLVKLTLSEIPGFKIWGISKRKSSQNLALVNNKGLFLLLLTGNDLGLSSSLQHDLTQNDELIREFNYKYREGEVSTRDKLKRQHLQKQMKLDPCQVRVHGTQSYRQVIYPK
ncbi:uncharacterized protein LOC134384209 [Cynocephalus volans]|uniref:uncharacterized protein LOC134384209 n=1 Tax=Cynocephalus volans TaxID=110931 RepID=UPI002FCCA02B